MDEDNMDGKKTEQANEDNTGGGQKSRFNFKIPISDIPSANPPCKAIMEAAEVNSIEGKNRRLTRKRFEKLIMSVGNGRNYAISLAKDVRKSKLNYRDILKRIGDEYILEADRAMDDLTSGRMLKAAESADGKAVESDDRKNDDLTSGRMLKAVESADGEEDEDGEVKDSGN